MQEGKKILMVLLQQSDCLFLLFHTAARECSRQVADQDDIVNRADDTVRDLKTFVIFQLERAGR